MSFMEYSCAAKKAGQRDSRSILGHKEVLKYPHAFVSGFGSKWRRVEFDEWDFVKWAVLSRQRSSAYYLIFECCCLQWSPRIILIPVKENHLGEMPFLHPFIMIIFFSERVLRPKTGPGNAFWVLVLISLGSSGKHMKSKTESKGAVRSRNWDLHEEIAYKTRLLLLLESDSLPNPSLTMVRQAWIVG
ncbi:hypothetical protein SSX86_001346 [Deinandra increscens subsp. villosa]|uniref:Uncharacterized protein n=1 Tax=Deinandra increscens subsp. villosa TaxID=3103831 RepID=A0AAP0DYV9_9ASTR